MRFLGISEFYEHFLCDKFYWMLKLGGSHISEEIIYTDLDD